MHCHSVTRVFVRSLGLSTLLALSVFGQTNTGVSQGVQIDVPAGGRIRVENQFGEVRIEVWDEKYVSLSATHGAAAARSPVVIQNRPQFLAISVMRRRTDPAELVDLTIKVPASSQLEVVGGNFLVEMHGVPSSASLTSLSGAIALELSASANADINAKSVSGAITTNIPQLAGGNARVLQARLGAGTQPLRISTQSGPIFINTLKSAAVAERPNDPRSGPPTLDPPTSAAGTPAPVADTQEISEDDIIRVDSQLVTLNMSVVDRNTNRGLFGLGNSDFKLSENGVEQKILQFESSAAPFDLLLLIDLSGSTRDKVALIRAAALRFINAARPFDRIGVITFAGKPSVISPLSLDRLALRERVNAMETAVVGDTKLYDATDFTATFLSEANQHKRRSAIVLMSDGLDGSIEGVQGDGSRLVYQDFINRVQEFDGVVYTLWLNTRYVALNPRDTQPEAFDEGRDQMEEIAEMGGGLFYEVQRLQDLAGAYERVVADLGTVYSLAYRPSDKARDGKWRAIKVDVNRPAAVARGKRGYYAN